MTDHPKEPTAKQWKRRALLAEQELELLLDARAHETGRELRNLHELAALRVALTEARDVINWALEQQT